MTLHGEGFLLFNVLVDGWIAASALRFLGVRVRMGRVILAALLGGVYTLLSLVLEPAASLGGLLLGALCMSAVVFPPGRIVPGMGTMLLIGLCGSGTAQALSHLGDTAALMGAMGLMVSFGWMGRREPKARRGVAVLEIGGETLFIPVLVDTGNVLRDPKSGQPVLVIPRKMMPPQEIARCIPHPIPAVTAAGRVTLEGIEPDGCRLRLSAGEEYRCCLTVALSDAPMPLGLFPAGAIRRQDEMEEVQHATGRRRSAGMADGASVRAEKRHGGVYRRRRAAAPATDGSGGKGTGDETCRGRRHGACNAHRA